MKQSGPIHLVVFQVLSSSKQELNQLLTAQTMTRGIVFNSTKERVAATVQHSTNVTALVIVVENGLIIGAVVIADRAETTLLLEQPSSSRLNVFLLEARWFIHLVFKFLKLSSFLVLSLEVLRLLDEVHEVVAVIRPNQVITL